jgi:hypothetical protein
MEQAVVMVSYEFDKQHELGKRYETLIDQYFSEWYDITPASEDEQRLGIDRHYQHKALPRSFTVEYKTDFVAERTHNAFIETISVDRSNKLGWAYTAQAAYLFYYIVGDDILYVMTFIKLRSQLARWVEKYRTAKTPNESYRGYNTIGLIVPLDEFERHAVHTLSPILPK